MLWQVRIEPNRIRSHGVYCARFKALRWSQVKPFVSSKNRDAHSVVGLIRAFETHLLSNA